MPSPTICYFISDLHLQASRLDITEAFEHFILHTSGDAHAIYILGDFFDAWIGDDNHSPLIKRIKHLLQQRIQSGCQIFFVHGNRDFLVGEDFEAQTGIKILAENTVIDICGEKTLILHGDALCTSDIDYQNFRSKVRNPQWQKKMLGYPLWLRKTIALYLRKRSRKANANKAENILDVDALAVEQAFRRHGLTRMIHGHTHRPARHSLVVDEQACERIVLGDWDNNAWYLKADANGLDLVKRPL